VERQSDGGELVTGPRTDAERCSGLRGRFVGELLLRESARCSISNVFGISIASKFEGDGHTKNTPAGVVD
jgi:hypothetical protein